MIKLIDYIKSKGMSDPSMANLYALICAHPGSTEDILVMGFTALYESNKKLAAYAVKNEQNKKANSPVITDSSGKSLSTSDATRKGK